MAELGRAGSRAGEAKTDSCRSANGTAQRPSGPGIARNARAIMGTATEPPNVQRAAWHAGLSCEGFRFPITNVKGFVKPIAGRDSMTVVKTARGPA